MADIFVAELSDLGHQESGQFILDLDKITAQSNLTYTTSASRTLNAATKYVYLVALGRGHVALGTGATTATAADFRVEAGDRVLLTTTGRDTIAVYDGVAV